MHFLYHVNKASTGQCADVENRLSQNRHRSDEHGRTGVASFTIRYILGESMMIHNGVCGTLPSMLYSVVDGEEIETALEHGEGPSRIFQNWLRTPTTM